LTEFQSAPAWALEAGGQYSAEQMLLARWFMWLNVYTHKTRRILDVHLAEFLAAYLAGGKFPSDVDGYLELTDRVVLGAIRDDDAFRGPLLERGHHRLVREFAASEFENPEGFKSAMAELGADFDAKVDDFSVRPSPPREEDFFVLGTDGQPQSMLEALEIIRPLEPRWFGRVYVPEAKREDAAVALQSLRGGGTPNVN
jgi:hypothetical protein